MKSLSKSWLMAVVVSGALMACVTASAQKGAKSSDGQQVADVVEELGIAAQLAAFGRGELNDLTGLKDFTSAEALVAAGGITLRAHKETAGQLKASEAQVTEDGKDIAAEGKPASLEAEAEALFDEARLLAKDKTALEAKIKEAKMITARGATGGPRVISRTVNTGKTHSLHIGFEPNSRAMVTMRGTGRTQFEVVGNGGNTLWHSKGSWGVFSWHTGKGGERNITVKVINKGGPPVAYSVITN